MCFKLLNYIKNRPTRYPEISTVDFLENVAHEKGIKIVGTEFEIGCTESDLSIAKPNEFGRDVFKTMFSPYMVVDFDGMITISGKVSAGLEAQRKSWKRFFMSAILCR